MDRSRYDCAGLALCVGLVAAVVGCREPAPVVTPAAPVPVSLLLDRAELETSAVPDLVKKLERSPFRYFRMLAPAYEQRTCAAFADLADFLPLTPVHGDAHVEQFVVTADTYGLEDFDRAGFGPAVIDLVRYAASIHVTCTAVPWRCNPDVIVEQFLTAYRESLVDPPLSRVPAVVQRLRARAPLSRARWLTWVDSLMTRLTPDTADKIAAGWQRFVEQMRPNDSAPAQVKLQSELAIVRVGLLRMGLGSALERKVLIRVQGPTSDPVDDVVIEAREGTPVGQGSCVWRGYYGESIVLMFTSIMGRRMPELHGLVDALGSPRYFWLQSWDPGYVELSLAQISNQRELGQLAVDAAAQLAAELWQRAASPRRDAEQYLKLLAFDVTRARVVSLARSLAHETAGAWREFRQAGAPQQ